MFFVTQFSICLGFEADKNVFKSIRLGVCVCFCSEGINNFHNAFGH